MNQEALEQESRMTKVETELVHCSSELTRLSSALRQHMRKEEEDRRALDKKLNTQTIILVILGFSALGGNIKEVLPLILSAL